MGRTRRGRHARPPAPWPAPSPASLPGAVVLRAECCGRGYLWPWPAEDVEWDSLDAGDLGLSTDLVRRLDDWYERWDALTMADEGPVPPAEDDRRRAAWAAWQQEGLDLAYDVQHELVTAELGIDVHYRTDDDPRPVFERRGR